jgi:hypothetical protein
VCGRNSLCEIDLHRCAQKGLSMRLALRQRRFTVSAPSDKPMPITSALDPDLGAVKTFIADSGPLPSRRSAPGPAHG